MERHTDISESSKFHSEPAVTAAIEWCVATQTCLDGIRFDELLHLLRSVARSISLRHIHVCNSLQTERAARRFKGQHMSMFATTNACAILGVEPVPVQVEANCVSGLPMITIIGMREADAREARERLRCGLASITEDVKRMRITVSLAPADIPKSGASMDLPMALAILATLGVIPPESIKDISSRAEVGLDGRLRPSPGTVASVLRAVQEDWREILVADDIYESVRDLSPKIVPVMSLQDAVHHLRGQQRQPRLRRPQPKVAPVANIVDMSDVRGQASSVQAVCVAAGGAHNLLLYGPPGCGKSMLAHRLPTLLPQLSHAESLEVAAIHDAAGTAFGLGDGLTRTFRAPHHSLSQAALIGGGSAHPVIGELTLAHHGVLFLDELPEYRPSCIDALRQPLEEQEVRIRRLGWSVRFPCVTQVVAAMNLCRCGRYGATSGRKCSCNQTSIDGYRQRVSGAILDRFDIRMRIHQPSAPIMSLPPATSSADLRDQVESVRAVQRDRWGEGKLNAHIRQTDDPRFALTSKARSQLHAVAARRGLSGRTQSAVIRVARTIADIDGLPDIGVSHLIDALSLAADQLEDSDHAHIARPVRTHQSHPDALGADADRRQARLSVLRKGGVATP